MHITYNPSKVRRRKYGFRAKSKKVISNRRRKGRKQLARP